MKLVRVFAAVAVVAGSVVLVPGCGDSPLDMDPKAVLASTEAALQSPSGSVSKTTMPNVIAKARQQKDANAAVGLTGLSGTSGLSSPASRPMGGNPLACIDGDMTEGSFDLGCLDPEFSGTMEFKVQIEGGGVYEMVALEDVCVNTVGECINGYMALGVISGVSQRIEAYASLDLSGAASGHVDFGFSESTGPDGTIIEIVAFDDAGDSYVLDANVDGDAGTVTVRGSNGTWTCSYTGAGASGSCTGNGSFDWGTPAG